MKFKKGQNKKHKSNKLSFEDWLKCMEYEIDYYNGNDSTRNDYMFAYSLYLN